MPKRLKKVTKRKASPAKDFTYLTVRALERAVSVGAKNEKSKAFAIFGTLKEIKDELLRSIKTVK